MHRLKSYLKVVFNFVLPEKQAIKSVRHLSLARLSEKLSPREAECGFVALFDYKDREIRNAVWALKYYEEQKIAEMFGNILYSYLLDELADRAIFDNVQSPLFIPIPLSKKKLRERGFNQSEHIIRVCADLDKDKTLELCLTALERVRDTESQAKMPGKQMREKNVKGAFRVKDKNVVFGRDIVLFDDVVTTGATLREAQSVLLSAGAKSVFGLAIAH